MISYYTSIVTISSLSLLIISIGTAANQNISKRTGRHFCALFLTIAALNWLEWLGSFLNGADTGLRWLHTAVKFAEHTITPAAPLIALKILDCAKPPKLLAAMFFVNLAAHIISLFNGCIYSVNGDNIYFRGPFYFLYMFTFLLGIFYVILYSFKFGKKYQFTNLQFMLMIMTLLIIGVIYPFAFSYLNLDWTCTSFALIMFYIYYCQLEQQIDSVTDLLNRKSFDYALSSLRKKAAIVFFDVDKFKDVNDNHGHGYADSCLNMLGSEMKRIFESKGYCYRFGGDEFSVIITKGVGETEKLIDKYVNDIAEYRMTDPRIPSVSAGYAYFDPSAEEVEAALKRADEMMYRNKLNTKQ